MKDVKIAKFVELIIKGKNGNRGCERIWYITFTNG